MALLGRDTSVTGPFPKGVLLLETLLGTEALGRPYKFDLSLLSKEPDLDPNDVLGKPLAVGIQLGTGEERFFHGIVTKFLKAGTTQLHTRYAAAIRPRLDLFNFTSECRIFNDPAQDALAIVKEVLSKRGLTDVESGSIVDHPFRARDFCVQYCESDLNFVQRLLEEEGIYYFFKHEEAKHTLVLADSITAHETAAGYESILYTSKDRKVAGAEEQFWDMKVRTSLYPGKHTVLCCYDPTKLRPKQPQFGEEPSEAPAPGAQFENYDNPGGLFVTKEAHQEALVRTQTARVAHTTIEVEGNTMGVGVGDLVSLRSGLASGEFSPFWHEEDWEKQYLVVAAAYSLSVDQYETGNVTKNDEPFKAKYQLLDSHTQFRPQRTARKPQMRGPQTALVVGPPGEEIWTDKFGRVMVQFDWDRTGERNEKSSCWVRVAQSWAGAEWGMQFLPRIGEEVVVAFLAGDPDRPIIRGHIYNKDHLPPYDLPENKTQSGIKTRSTKGGTAANFNEIRFEDKKGQEELHLQAERDMSTLIKQCQAMNVGTDRIVLVGNNETNHVKQNRSLWVEANDSVVIGGTHDKTVTGTVTQIYGGDHSRKVDGEQELFAEKNKDEHVKEAHKLTTDKKFQLNQGATRMTFKGSNVTVDSAGTITLTAGGATVCFDKTGKATFDSPTGIKLECGASSLTILPGGIAIASPNVTAAAGAGSTMALGEAIAAMNSKTVTIVADGVCTIKGTSALKLQEAEGVKAKKAGAASSADEGRESATTRKRFVQKRASANSTSLEICVVDLNQEAQEGLAFKIKMPDGGIASGKLDKEGRGLAKSSSPGIFEVTFPDLDRADWDGFSEQELPEERRSEASRYKVEQGDRLPTIARKKGFVRWQTIWDFAGNAALKKLRGNAHILFPGDEVAIPTKLARVAEVYGGEAEFVLLTAPEVLRVRFAEAEATDGEPVLFRATPDAGSDCFEGELGADGTMEIELPPDTTKVTVELFCGEGDNPFVTYQVNVGGMDPLSENTGIQARLANLGYYDGKIDGDIGGVTKSAIARFRREYGLRLSDEVGGDLRNALQWVHDDDDDTGDCESDHTTPEDFMASERSHGGPQGESEDERGADDDSVGENSGDFDDEDLVDWEDDEGELEEGDEDDDSGEVTP